MTTIGLHEILSMSISELARRTIEEKKEMCIKLARDSCIKNRVLIWALILDIKNEDKFDAGFTLKLQQLALEQLRDMCSNNG